MREPICELVNSLFYTSRPLATHPSANGGGEPFPLGSSPLLYIDTGPYHPWAALREGTYSRYTLFHALLIHNLVLRLADSGFLPDGHEPNDAVGVIAPYAAQADLIQTLLDDRLGDRASGMAATVHRFQGNEKSAMVLDLTDSLGTRLGRFLKATAVDEVGARLLNVAASRARHHVVLVANLAYLRSKASPRSLVRRMADHFTEHGESVDVTSLLPYGGAESVPVSGVLAGVTKVFTERGFYPAFEEDLAKARKSIVLLSPFATKQGTERWVATLRPQLAAGVKVRVFTRPPGSSGSMAADYTEEVIGRMRDLGVDVELRPRMHEKVAILDDEVLWHGSLNILSHRDTEESMLRFHSPAVCQVLTSYVFGKAARRRGRGKKKTARRRPTARAGSPCPEAGCEGSLTRRDGQYGPFLGCTRFPRCRHSADLPAADA